jgi:hypothetical protein
MKQLLLLFCFFLTSFDKEVKSVKNENISKQYITVLGIAQDAE